MGFRELAYQNSGIKEALDGNTILVFTNDKPAASVVHRHYYKLLNSSRTKIKQADSLSFSFYGGGRILILYATKQQKLDKYDRDNTYFRLDWRK